MEILVEIDGPNVRPESVDTVMALELASAYFALLHQMALAEGERLRLEGVEVRDKCMALAVRAELDQVPAADGTDSVDRILFLLEAVDECARGGASPEGGEQFAKRLRAARARLPEEFSAKVIAGPWTRAIETVEEAGLDVRETVELRVRVIGVGGDRQPRVRVTSDSEESPFGLDVTREQAMALGKHLYAEVDVCAVVRRGPDGTIRTGRLSEFFLLGDDEPAAAWIEWARQNIVEWGDDEPAEDDGWQD